VIVDLVRREITGLELMYELSRKEKKNRGWRRLILWLW
jgi:hypothetical protein